MLEVERLCDRVIIMKRGRIEDDDSPDSIMARYNRGDVGGGVSRRRPRPRSGRCAMSELVSASRGIAPHRINAMILRYWYLLDVVVAASAGIDLLAGAADHHLGLPAELHLAECRVFARAGGTLIGAVILWDILFRGQLGFSISFLEEMWARNLGNLMMSPLKPIEFLISLMVMSLIRLAIGVIPMTLLAMFFFDFNFYGIGLPLIAFFCNLIFTSWSLGIFVSGLVLRNGLGAESIVWTLMFGVMPLACIYYPVTVLPHWLQYVAWALPPTYVFEGMRALLIDHVFRADLMIEALLINVVLFIASFAIFLALLRSATPPWLADPGWRISHLSHEFEGLRLVCRVDIPICALTLYYAFGTMLRCKRDLRIKCRLVSLAAHRHWWPKAVRRLRRRCTGCTKWRRPRSIRRAP